MPFQNIAYNSLMQHEPGSLHARLRETTDHAWRLYCALETEVTHPQSTSSGQERISRQRRSSSPTPGNSVAMGLTLDFANEIRRLEVQLKGRLTGGYHRRRGPSDANTRHAIDSVVDCCETSDNVTILGVLSYITTWTRRAEIYFTPQNGLYRLPRQPGEGEARCPYCSYATMRWNPGRGIAVCIRPACLNPDGHRPRWNAIPTALAGQLVFHWQEQEAA